jgi:transketolase
MNLDMQSKVEQPSRDGYGRALVQLGKKNKNVVALCCDLTDSTRVAWFKEKFPKRFVEIGVAEQNMAGIAAGMATMGKIPFISSYAVFSPGRNWDQIRVSICYSKLNVKIEGAHAGISVGPDGATHQALEDIAIMRVLPNMTVIVPADANQAEKATLEAGKITGPVYLRFGREKIPLFTTLKTPFKIGKADIYHEGTEVCIIACGLMVYEAMIAAEKLKAEGISAMVINCHTIKPLDVKTLVAAAKKTGAVVTAEEHQIHGGLGSAVAEALSMHHPVPIEMVAVKDSFGESGTQKELLEKFGLTHKDIILAAKQALIRKRQEKHLR